MFGNKPKDKVEKPNVEKKEESKSETRRKKVLKEEVITSTENIDGEDYTVTRNKKGKLINKSIL